MCEEKCVIPTKEERKVLADKRLQEEINKIRCTLVEKIKNCRVASRRKNRRNKYRIQQISHRKEDIRRREPPQRKRCQQINSRSA